MSIDNKITNQLKDKYKALDQNVNTHLEGLLHSKPIDYWDYIQTDALLNLQVQRTTLPDEMVFLMFSDKLYGALILIKSAPNSSHLLI